MTTEMERARWWHDNVQMTHNAGCAGCELWGTVPDRTTVHPEVYRCRPHGATRKSHEQQGRKWCES